MAKQVKRFEMDESYKPSHSQTGVNLRDHAMVAVCTLPVKSQLES
jgi:hypothetical protein